MRSLGCKGGSPLVCHHVLSSLALGRLPAPQLLAHSSCSPCRQDADVAHLCVLSLRGCEVRCLNGKQCLGQQSVKPLLQLASPCTAIMQQPDMHPATKVVPSILSAMQLCQFVQVFNTCRQPMPLSTSQCKQQTCSWAFSQLLRHRVTPGQQRHGAPPDTPPLPLPSGPPHTVHQDSHCTAQPATQPGMLLSGCPHRDPATPPPSSRHFVTAMRPLSLGRHPSSPMLPACFVPSSAYTFLAGLQILPSKSHALSPTAPLCQVLLGMCACLLACRSYPPRRRTPSRMLAAARRGRAVRGRPLSA